MKISLLLLSAIFLSPFARAQVPEEWLQPRPPVCQTLAQMSGISVKVYIDEQGANYCYGDSQTGAADVRVLPGQLEDAWKRIRSTRPGAQLDFDPLWLIVFQFRAPDECTVDGCRPGFHVTDDPAENAALIAWKPKSASPTGYFLAAGYTVDNGDWRDQPDTGFMVILNLLASRIVLPDSGGLVSFEAVHGLWYLLYSGIFCPGTVIPQSAVVQEGILCDPFKQ